MFSKLPRPKSIEGSPVSVGAPSSTFSDVESVVSLSDQEHSDADTTEDPNSTAVHPEFAFADGNIEIQTMDQTFWVHEYYINKFSVFATLIQAAKNSRTVSSPGRRITVDCNKKTKGEDLYNTLKVIYASHVDGIPDFDSNTLISTLRIASTYDYPGLRKFAISKLEAIYLPAIQRIQLSDEFLVPSFEMPAFTELCSRPEPISTTEAEVLGITRFAEIARIREMQRTRWAVEVIKAINGDLLQTSDLVDSPQPESSDDGGSKSDTSDSACDHFEYISGRLSLPTCNCRIRKTVSETRVSRCDIHTVAPRLLTEGQKLFKQRNELLKRLGNIRSAVDCRLERKGFLSSSDVFDLEAELSRASWTHRECTTTSS